MGLEVFSSMSSFLGSALNTAGGIYNNERNIAEARKTREDNQAFEANEAQLNRDFQSKEAELAFEREVDFYEKYKSPQAQVQAYKEAGLNPALLAGGMGASSSPSASAPSGAQGHSSGSAPVNSNPFSFVADAFDFAGLAQALEQRKADIEKTRAETGEIIERTKGYEGQRRLTDVGVDKVIAEIDKFGAESEKIFQDIKESVKRMDLMDNQIKVGDSVIEFNVSQTELAALKSAAQKLDNEKAKILLPFVAEREQAEIAYQNAKTDEAIYSAEGLMYEANLSMLKVLVEQDMIDKGYYDSVREQAHWDAKYKKREYKWKPINDIVSGVSKLVLAGASAVSAASGSGAFTTDPVVTTPPTMNFW